VRGRVIDAIYRRMGENPDIFFLTADMGINLVEPIQESYPSRYLNVGIAEQNLISVSAGLCNLGFRPFAYAISHFVTQRCLEQFRNDVVLHAYPVTLVGTQAGFDNAPLGPTHHIVDDWGVLRSLPLVRIYCPSSVSYAETLVDRVLEESVPAYIRIPTGSFDTPDSAGDAVLVGEPMGRVLLVSYGAPVQNCLKVRGRRTDVNVLVLNKLRPLPGDLLAEALGGHEVAVTVEDHSPDTGLCGALCQFAVERGIGTHVAGAGPRGYSLRVGSSAHYYERMFGIDPDGIEQLIDENLARDAVSRAENPDRDGSSG